MIKSKEELAKEYVGAEEVDRLFPSGNWPYDYNFKHVLDAHIAGFDAGFARAVSMLRSKKARIFGLDQHEDPTESEWADWLEKHGRVCDPN